MDLCLVYCVEADTNVGSTKMTYVWFGLGIVKGKLLEVVFFK